MKPQHIQKTVASVLAIACLHCFGQDFVRIEAGRKKNKDGDITVTYERDLKKESRSGFQLVCNATERQWPPLSIHGLYFADAKVDKQNDRVAIVYMDGLYVVYASYVCTDKVWRRERHVSVAEYNLAWQQHMNRIELEDFDTVRASFIPEGQTYETIPGRKRGVEEAGDRVYHIRVVGNETLVVNGNESAERWRPQLKRPQLK